jgi:hypothetical protein
MQLKKAIVRGPASESHRTTTDSNKRDDDMRFVLENYT